MKISEVLDEAGPAGNTPSVITPLATTQDDGAERRGFKVFPELPTELRLKIWGMAPEGRTIEVRFDQHNGTYSYILVANNLSIMRACKESRNEGLKAYKHFFTSPLAKNTILFNPKIDTLYITSRSTPAQRQHFKSANMADLKLVENVLLPLGHFAETFMLWDLNFSPRAHVPFKGLEKITLLDTRAPNTCTKHQDEHENRVCITDFSGGLPRVPELDAARVNVANLKVILNAWEEQTGGIWKMPAIHYGKLCLKGIANGGLYA